MKVIVNGVSYTVESGEESLCLLDWLRERLDLTGAKDGCHIGRCGSCTVLVDDKPTLACKTKITAVAGRKVQTIEGMTNHDGTLHPLQQSFVDHGAIQCGFCTPGMVLRAHGFLLRKPNPTREDIRQAISPNLCRCTGYQQIIDAIEAVAPGYADKKEPQKRRGE